MDVLGLDKITKAKKQWPQHANALDRWVILVKGCQASNPIGMKQTFTLDVVSPYTVFDIAGNHLRIAAKVSYSLKNVTVMYVLDHKTYDEGKWKI